MSQENVEESLYPGGLITGILFCLLGDGPITGGEGRRVYNGDFTVGANVLSRKSSLGLIEVEQCNIMT